MNYNRLSKISFTIITFALIIFLINSQILENFIWKSDKKFIDFTILISWLECNYLGFDVYDLENTKKCPNFYSIIYQIFLVLFLQHDMINTGLVHY